LTTEVLQLSAPAKLNGVALLLTELGLAAGIGILVPLASWYEISRYLGICIVGLIVLISPALTSKKMWMLLLFASIIPAKYRLISFAEHVYLIPSDFIILLFLFYLLLMTLRGRLKVGPVPFFLFGLALISVIVASLNAATVHAVGYVKILLFDILAFYAATVLVSDSGDLEYVLKVALIFGAALAVGGLVEFLNLGTDLLSSVGNLTARERWALRVGGTWTYPAYLGAGLNLIIPIAFACAIEFTSRPRLRLLSQIAFVLMLSAAAATITRSVLLSTMASLFLLLLYYRRRLFRGRGLLVWVVVAILVTVSPLGQLILSRFSGLGQSGIDQESFIERFKVWKEALRLFSQSPLIGIGPFSFLTKGRVGYHQIHNYWLQLLTELGLLGCVAFAALFGMMFLRLCRVSRNVSRPWRGAVVGVMVAWIGIMLQAFSDNHLFAEEFGIAFWFLTGAVWHLNRKPGEADV
jgi:O-antigen ligase